MKLLSLAASRQITPSGAANDDNFINTIIFLFQCWYVLYTHQTLRENLLAFPGPRIDFGLLFADIKHGYTQEFYQAFSSFIDLRSAQVYCVAIFLVSQEVSLNFHRCCG